ncbi:HPr family phosphocarrier protein [Domibacillus iocasae]|uniref:Phosphocarrier protein Chr n=1 Tax=Domibacillus iocasae TaxID=1714016 RepID=A0A1E7DST8_9BACI|nr:HPr family phosphocarrier protein [Domibacillus iocasae]OES46144.1 phosphocarrier protein Chr [Domibacillus iocasae]
MAEKTVQVQLKSGLQARPAALFVQEATRFNSEIFLEKDGKKINAKSIMGIMSIALSNGEEVTISAEGRDSEEAVDTMAALVEREEWL